MTYSVKETFYTLQGEGAQSGRPAVFCRFAGCNLWSGREDDRANAVCRFCDTDFVGTDGLGGGRFASADALAMHVDSFWPAACKGAKFVVLTGGEPMLQIDAAFVEALHVRGFEIAIETNGTFAVLPGIDWICVSPKAGAPWVQRSGSELKVIWPQEGLDLDELERSSFTHRFLQPMDNREQTSNTERCIEQCLRRPLWKLSLQTHKWIGIR